MTQKVTIHYEDNPGPKAPLIVEGVVGILFGEHKYKGDFVTLDQGQNKSTLIYLQNVSHILEEQEE